MRENQKIIIFFIIATIVLILLEKMTKDASGNGLIKKMWCLFNPVSCAIQNNADRR
jgi:hypothetical protein